MHLNYIFLLFLGWKVFFHPFYISLTEIRYNPTNERLEIAQKIFWDDLEVALADLNQVKINFLNPEDKNALEAIAESYLLEQNQITVNGKKVKLNYLGFEIEEDAAWFYLESEKVELPQEVEVYNNVLIQHFDGQQNIINFYIDKKPKSLILYKDREKGILKF